MANEKRLIDVNAVLKWLDEITDPKEWLVSQYNADWIWSMLDSAPTVDAVEVVRCKDCKHSYMGVANLMCGRCGQHINGIRLGGVSVKEEHFCSYGERREGEDE